MERMRPWMRLDGKVCFGQKLLIESRGASSFWELISLLVGAVLCWLPIPWLFQGNLVFCSRGLDDIRLPVHAIRRLGRAARRLPPPSWNADAGRRECRQPTPSNFPSLQIRALHHEPLPTQGMAGLSLWLLTGPPLIPTHKARVPRLSSASHTPMTGDARLSLRAATAPFAAGNAPWRPWDLLTTSYSKHGRPQAQATPNCWRAPGRAGSSSSKPRAISGQDRTGCRHPWTVMEEEDGTPCCPPCCQWEEWRPPGRAAPAGVLHPTPRTPGHAGITLDALQFAGEPANGQPRQTAGGSPVLTAGMQAAVHSKKMRLPRVGGRWEPPARGRALRLIPTFHRRGHSSTGGWLLDMVRTMDECGCPKCGSGGVVDAGRLRGRTERWAQG